MINPSRQITIGLLAGSSNDPRAKILANEIVAWSQKQNIRLVLYAFDEYHSGITRHENGDVVYDLANSSSIDALIVFGYLSHNVSEAVVRAYCEHFRPLPLVTLAIKIPGFPYVINDDSVGMRELMAHLLDKHHYERIAFIGGPVGQEEAECRKNVFITEMENRGIPVREEWVVHGDFTFRSGFQAMSRLMGEGKPLFQGVVLANDTMALGAQEYLESKGYKVPNDFFLTGFDNIHSQSLTTVSLSMPIMLQEAVQKVCQILRGEISTEQTIIPSYLIVRESCGCTMANRQIRESSKHLSLIDKPQWQLSLIEAFKLSVDSPTDEAFLNDLQSLVDQRIIDSADVLCQIILAELKNPLSLMLSDNEEKLLDKGCMLIYKNMLCRETKDRYQAEVLNEKLRAISENLENSVSMTEVMDILAQDLPEMGFKACWLSLFDDPKNPDRSPSLKLWFDQNGRHSLPPDGVHFHSRSLRPEGIRTTGLNEGIMIVEILYSRQDLLGFVLFDTNFEGTLICDALRSKISGAIVGAKLWEERKRTEIQLVQSEKMAALGALVAGVAHEINTPIGVCITASSDLRIRASEMIELQKSGEVTRSKFSNFMQVMEEESRLIEENLLRAGELIQIFKNVAVDQSHERPRLFRLGEYLKDIITSIQPMLRPGGHHCEVAYPQEIELYGPPETFALIFSNLIANSVLHGFENRREGNIHILCSTLNGLVHIDYNDDGKGISQENIGKIFEPFFTTKLGHGGSGLGLHIVYNQITHIWKGTIICESTLGQGTNFRICFPIPAT